MEEEQDDSNTTSKTLKQEPLLLIPKYKQEPENDGGTGKWQQTLLNKRLFEQVKIDEEEDSDDDLQLKKKIKGESQDSPSFSSSIEMTETSLESSFSSAPSTKTVKRRPPKAPKLPAPLEEGFKEEEESVFEKCLDEIDGHGYLRNELSPVLTDRKWNLQPFGSGISMSVLDAKFFEFYAPISSFPVSKEKIEFKPNRENMFTWHCISGCSPTSLRAKCLPEWTFFTKDASLLSWLCGFVLPKTAQEMEQYFQDSNRMSIWKVPIVWSHCLKVTMIKEMKFEPMVALKSLFTMNMELKASEDCPVEELIEGSCAKGLLREYRNLAGKRFEMLEDPFIMTTGEADHNQESQAAYYLAWNTRNPINMDGNEDFMSVWKNNTVQENYCTDKQGKWKSSTFVKESLVEQAKRIWIWKALVLDVMARNRVSNPKDVNLKVKYFHSANPIFHISEILLKANNIKGETIECVPARKYQNHVVLFSQKPRKGSLADLNMQTITLDLACKKFSKALISYADLWLEHKQKAYSIIESNQMLIYERTKTYKKEVADLPLLKEYKKKKKVNFENMTNEQIEKLLTNHMQDPLQYYILNGTIEATDAIKGLIVEAKKSDNSHLRQRLVSMVRSMQAYDSLYKAQETSGPVYKERRLRLAEFVTNHVVKEVSYEVEIGKITTNGEYYKMVEAVKIWILLCLKEKFVIMMMLYILKYDQETKDTKVPGIFLIGSPSFGKSKLWEIILLPFMIFRLQNSNRNVISVEDQMSNKVNKSEDDKYIDVYPNFILADEFNPKGSNRPDTLSQHDLNSLNDWSKEVWTLDMKYKTIRIRTKACMCASSHHKADEWIKNFDPSFHSRWGACIDFDDIIIGKRCYQKFPKEPQETEQNYRLRMLKTKGAPVYEKPVFPLSIKSNNTSQVLFKEKYSKIFEGNTQLYKEIGAPEHDCLQQLFDRQNKTREDMLKGNKIAEEYGWSNLSSVSEVQASYIFYQALIELWDQLWVKLKDDQREMIFPLRSERALQCQVYDGLGYDHSMFERDALKPSNLLKFQGLLERPQRLANEIVRKEQMKSGELNKC